MPLENPSNSKSEMTETVFQTSSTSKNYEKDNLEEEKKEIRDLSNKGVILIPSSEAVSEHRHAPEEETRLKKTLNVGPLRNEFWRALEVLQP